jgi:RNA polymerase sigma factor (sigma-70 family)
VVVDAKRREARLRGIERLDSSEPSEKHHFAADVIDELTRSLKKEVSHALEAALDRIPSRQRGTVMMRSIEGKTIAAIARELHVDPKTTRQDLAKARRELGRWLAPFDLRESPVADRWATSV